MEGPDVVLLVLYYEFNISITRKSEVSDPPFFKIFSTRDYLTAR